MRSEEGNNVVSTTLWHARSKQMSESYRTGYYGNFTTTTTDSEPLLTCIPTYLGIGGTDIISAAFKFPFRRRKAYASRQIHPRWTEEIIVIRINSIPSIRLQEGASAAQLLNSQYSLKVRVPWLLLYLLWVPTSPINDQSAIDDKGLRHDCKDIKFSDQLLIRERTKFDIVIHRHGIARSFQMSR